MTDTAFRVSSRAERARIHAASRQLVLNTAELHVTPWVDALVEANGFELRHPYIEAYCTSYLSPTTVLFLRKVGLGLALCPQGISFDVDALTASLGIGDGRGKWGPWGRAIERMQRFGVARPTAPDTLAVRRALPPLTRRQIEKLPPVLQAQHHTDLLQWKGAGR